MKAEQRLLSKEMASQTGKLDVLLEMSEQHSELHKARLSTRAKMFASVCTLVGVIVTALLAAYV